MLFGERALHDGWLFTDHAEVDVAAFMAQGWDAARPVRQRRWAVDGKGRVGHVALEPNAAGDGYRAAAVSAHAWRFFMGLTSGADGAEELCAIEELGCVDQDFDA
jgi:hypothetical protein